MAKAPRYALMETSGVYHVWDKERSGVLCFMKKTPLTQAQAERVMKAMNIAFDRGVESAQQKMKDALGVI